MRIKTLKMLVLLAEKGSYSAVAEELDISQPAVSMQINSLEDNYEVELVERRKGEVQLTPAGRAFYRHGRRILSRWQRLEDEMDKVKREDSGHISLGGSTIPSTYLLPDVMADFSKDFPEVKMSLSIGDSEHIIKLLKNREVDLAVIGKKPRSGSLKVRPVLEDRLKLIFPGQDNSFRCENIAAEDIPGRRVIIREEGSGTRRAMLNGLRDAGVRPEELNVRAEMASNEAVIAAVEAGLGISFISRLAANKAREQGRVQVKDVEDMLITRKFYLSYQKDRSGEALLEEFEKRIMALAD